MSYECFEITEDGGVATVTLARPDNMNAMNAAFWNELPAIINELSDSGRARAVVLASQGKHFCAGMDLAEFGNDGPAIDHSGTRQQIRSLQQSLSSLEHARMPVLAAIHGACVGGGLDMITAADMRYATESAFFCVQQINIGMPADLGTLQRLPTIIPVGVARELAFTGRRMSANEAKSVGLVNEVYASQDDMLAAVADLAKEIANKSPTAIWGTKQVMNYSRDHGVPDGLEYMATWQTGMLNPEDTVEAFTAQSEGRDPSFADLAPAPRGL